MGGAGGGRGLRSEGCVRGRDRPRHSSGRHRRSRMPSSILRVAVPVGRPRPGIFLQAYPGHKIWIEPARTATSRVDSFWILQQGDWNPPESVGTDCQEPHPPYSPEGRGHQSFGYCRAMPIGGTDAASLSLNRETETHLNPTAAMADCASGLLINVFHTKPVR